MRRVIALHAPFVVLSVVFLSLCGLTAAPAMASAVAFVMDDSLREQPLGRYLEIVEEPFGIESPEFVIQQWERLRPQPSDRDIPNVGVSRSAWWSKVTLTNTSAQTQWFFEHGDGNTETIDVFLKRQDGPLTHFRGGSSRPWIDRAIPSLTSTFPLHIATGETVEVYTRVASSYVVVMPLTLWAPEPFWNMEKNRTMFHGLYAGLSLAMLLYHAFMGAMLRDRLYLLYVGTILSTFVFNSTINGTAIQYVFPNSTMLTTLITHFSAMAIVPLVSLMAMDFIDLSEKHRQLARRLIAASVSLWSLALFDPHLWTITIGLNGQIICTVLMVLTARTILRGSRAALYFGLGFLSFLLSAFVLVLGVFGLIPFVGSSMEIGACIEAVFLSLAVSQRLRDTHDDRERVQRELAASKQKALQHLSHYNRRLESEVSQRTRELLDTQKQLVANEKMAALGIFTAGIAHEINNPANFVSLGRQNAKSQLQQLQKHIESLIDPDADQESRDTFKPHFGRLHESMELISEGISRIENVVQRLRIVHPEGRIGKQPADPASLLESAWEVVSPSFALKVTLHTRFEARRLVNCSVADMYQVFIALFSNASHAIADRHREGEAPAGEIMLTTLDGGQWLIITIADNGIGIPFEYQPKVFDPFFTTRPVGQGSGLGLAMARDVVHHHGGEMGVVSAPNNGALFTIRLPYT
jgi:signal transduction histidine kinase